MQIGYLADHQEFIPTLAQWHHREWAYLRPGDSLEARTARLRASCGHREIPTVIVSFTGDTLLGSAVLLAHDMDTRMELSPWPAGVSSLPTIGGTASVLRWSGGPLTMRPPLACGGFTSTLRAQSCSTHASGGRLSSERATERRMS